MDVTQTLKDSSYVVVGLGVLGFQRAQVARRDLAASVAADRERLEASVKAQVGDVAAALDLQLSEVKTQVAKVVTTLEPVARKLDDRLDVVGQHLPPPVQSVVATARQVAGSAATQVRSLLAA